MPLTSQLSGTNAREFQLKGDETVFFDGEKLRALRQQHNLTTAALAKGLGKSRGYITQLELGQRQPSEEFANELALFLNVKPTQLLSEAESQDELPVMTREEDYIQQKRGETARDPAELVLRPFMVLGLVQGFLRETYTFLTHETLPPSVSVRGTLAPWG